MTEQPLRRIESIKIYQNARSHHKAAGRLYRAMNDDAEATGHTDLQTIIPQFMLRVFASELYMKAAYAAENSEALIKGHDLRILFQKLSPEFRERVREQWRTAIDQDPAILKAKQLSPDLDFDLDKNIQRHRLSFERLRYAHEFPKFGFQIGNLPVALRRALLVLHPEWEASESS